MTLLPVTEVAGGAEIRPGSPGIKRHRNVLFTPHRHGGAWGLFERSGAPIEAAIDRRGPDGRLLFQQPVADVRYDDVAALTPRAEYVYVGQFNGDFGQFLVETLPRFWWLKDGLARGQKLLIHSINACNFFDGFPLAQEVFAALGLGQSDFFFSDEPMRVGAVTVPSPSLRQQAWAHPDYLGLCRRIGRRLLAGRTMRRSERPVWLSGGRLDFRFGRLRYEARLERALAEAGVEVVDPTALTLADQVALFACRTTVLGAVSPVFMLSAFVPEPPRVVALCAENRLDSNFALLDRLTGAQADYLYAPDARIHRDPTGAAVMVALSDPVAVAGDLLARLPAAARPTTGAGDARVYGQASRAESRVEVGRPRMQLAPACEYWGGAEIRSDEPGTTVVEDVYYVPHQPDAGWGIFDRHDAIVEAAVDRAQADQQMMGQLADPPVGYVDVRRQAPDADYIYVGRFNPHFGHFLVEVLPRYWSVVEGLRPGQKLVIHGTAPDSFLEEFGYAAEVFSAMGLGKDDFFWSPEPVRLGSVTIPHPTFSQQAWARPAYARFCRQVGLRLTAEQPPVPEGRPVWLSKSRLSQGVSHIDSAQEQALESVLAQAGVEIVHPERLTFADQVRLFASRRTILGATGSAMHVAMFAPPTARIIALSLDHLVNSNYLMMDRLRGRDIEFYHDPEGWLNDADPQFLTTARLSDPEGVARALLALL